MSNSKVIESLKSENRNLRSKIEQLEGELKQVKDHRDNLLKRPPEYARRWEMFMKTLQVTKFESSDELLKAVKFGFDFTAKGLSDETLEKEGHLKVEK